MGRIGLAGEYPLRSEEETLLFGQQIAQNLPSGTILALSGDLGAGKTTFVQGLAQGLDIKDPVQSPTFSILNIYPGLYHFDLYRLKNEADFLGLGFDEYFQKSGVCAIEWPERIPTLLPPRTISIRFAHAGEQRIATIS
jgi:tRNA threonylcarbamoyladenosine biosynthesis protein TsaE